MMWERDCVSTLVMAGASGSSMWCLYGLISFSSTPSMGMSIVNKHSASSPMGDPACWVHSYHRVRDKHNLLHNERKTDTPEGGGWRSRPAWSISAGGYGADIHSPRQGAIKYWALYSWKVLQEIDLRKFPQIKLEMMVTYSISLHLVFQGFAGGF